MSNRLSLAMSLPQAALPPNVVLDARAIQLCEQLSLAARDAEIPAQEADRFAEKLVRVFCGNASAAGAALRPPDVLGAPARGQIRRVFAEEVQPRARTNTPLIVLIAETIIQETLAIWRSQNPDQSQVASRVSEQAQFVLAKCTAAIEKLAADSRWQMLSEMPSQNYVFQLHYHTWGFPAYAQLGAQMHRGLCARMNQLQHESSSRQQKAIGAYVLVAKALIPVLSPSFLREMADSTETWQLWGIVRRVAERLHGIKPSTRAQYTSVFVHMLTGKASQGRFHSRPKGLARDNESSELDPDDFIEQRGGVTEWVTAHLYNATKQDVVPVLEEIAGLPVSAITEMEGLTVSEAHWQSRFLRNRLVIERNLQLFSPGVPSLGELAAYYAAVLWKDDSADMYHSLNRASRFLFLDTLIHTGRDPTWLASVQIGKRSDTDTAQRRFLHRDAQPVFDPDYGCIFYRRPSELYLPRQLQLPVVETNETVADWHARCQAHGQQYHRLEFVQAVPLSDQQLALAANYRRWRERAKQKLTSGRLARSDSEPFFVLAEAKGLRPWSTTDTRQLFQRVTRFIESLHPGWNSVQPAQLAKAFRAFYVAQFGLDPIFAAYVSGDVPEQVEQPLHYSLVDSVQLRRTYAAAQVKFRAQLAAEYARAWHRYPTLPLPWTRQRPIQASRSRREFYGSWRCPPRDHVALILDQLVKLTHQADPIQAHNARVTLLAAMLQITLGIRPSEIIGMEARAVDFHARTLTLVGKFNYAYDAYRQLPIPRELVGLLRWVLYESPQASERKTHSPLFQMYRNGKRVAAQLNDIQLLWEQAAIATGKMTSEQIPELGSLRHLYRTFALQTGQPHEFVNALMGHQSGGGELYNPYLNRNPRQVFEVGLKLATDISRSLHFDPKQIGLKP